MRNRFLDGYKKLEFGQKVIILVSVLAFITSILSISVMLNIDNIEDLILSNASFPSTNFSLYKVGFIIITLITICIFTLIL